MTTQKQVRARTRNWNKAQVKCIEAKAKEMLRGKEMYVGERILLDGISNYCGEILRLWEPKPPTLTEEVRDGKAKSVRQGPD